MVPRTADESNVPSQRHTVAAPWHRVLNPPPKYTFHRWPGSWAFWPFIFITTWLITTTCLIIKTLFLPSMHHRGLLWQPLTWMTGHVKAATYLSSLLESELPSPLRPLCHPLQKASPKLKTLRGSNLLSTSLRKASILARTLSLSSTAGLCEHTSSTECLTRCRKDGMRLEQRWRGTQQRRDGSHTSWTSFSNLSGQEHVVPDLDVSNPFCCGRSTTDMYQRLRTGGQSIHLQSSSSKCWRVNQDVRLTSQ